jgi:hypothetical protein
MKRKSRPERRNFQQLCSGMGTHMRSAVTTTAAAVLLADLSAGPSRMFSALNLLAQDRGETRNVLKIRVPATSSPYR